MFNRQSYLRTMPIIHKTKKKRYNYVTPLPNLQVENREAVKSKIYREKHGGS